MKKSFWVPISPGPVGLPRCCPCPGCRAPLSDRIDQKRAQIDEAKQKEGVLSTTIQRFSTRIDGLQGEISATQTRLDRAQSSLDAPEGGAARGARPARGGARPARAAALRAGHRAQGARGPAGRDLQGRRARRADGRARGRRLRRPARARRVPRAHLRPGPRDHRPTSACCATAPRARRSSSPTSSSASSSPPSASCASATRSPRRRPAASRSRDQLASARADKRGALGEVRDDSRVALEGDLRRSRPSRRAWPAALQGAPRRRPGRAPAS